jgi:hypothetical protein
MFMLSHCSEPQGLEPPAPEDEDIDPLEVECEPDDDETVDVWPPVELLPLPPLPPPPPHATATSERVDITTVPQAQIFMLHVLQQLRP